MRGCGGAGVQGVQWAEGGGCVGGGVSRNGRGGGGGREKAIAGGCMGGKRVSRGRGGKGGWGGGVTEEGVDWVGGGRRGWGWGA